MTLGRAAISLGALGAAVLLLRAPEIRIGSRLGPVGEAHEESAYVLAARPVEFRVPAGMRSLRLLLNFDLPEGAAREATPFEVRVHLEPDGRDEVFEVFGKAGVAADESPASFYLDSARQPSLTRLLGLARDRDDAGTLTVSLTAPSRDSGVVRLKTFEQRALGTAEPRWVSVPAVEGSARRRVYLTTPVPSSPTPTAPGIDVRPGRVAAWTIVGPATVSLAAVGRIAGHVNLVGTDGKSVDRALDLPEEGVASYSLGAGLTSIRFTPTTSGRVWLAGPASAAGELARAIALPNGRTELRARSTVVEAARIGAGETRGVSFVLAGRPADVPLRLETRAVLSDEAPPAPMRVSWRVAADDGHELARGDWLEAARPAPEDALEGVDAAVSEAAVRYLWAPRDAARLTLTADREVAVTAYSPAWLDEPSGEGDLDDDPAAASVRLRHGPPPTRRAFFKVTPMNESALAAAGRLDRLLLAPRLEARPAPPRPPAQSLVPDGRVARVEMLVPDRASVGLPTQVWAVTVGREQAFSSPGGSAKLIYAAIPGATTGAIGVTVDGRVAQRAALYAPRGDLTLGIPAGEHRLLVEAPPGTSVFFSRPLGGAGMFRRVAVHPVPIEGGARLRVRLRKAHERYVLGAVLYGREPAGADARLEVLVDGGHRVAGAFLSRDRTPLRRALALRADAMASCLLLNTDVAPRWQSRPVFFTLGDDLPAGTHDVTFAGRGWRGPVLVRLFGHDGSGHTDPMQTGPLALDASP